MHVDSPHPLQLPFPANEETLLGALHHAISAGVSNRIIAEDFSGAELSAKKFWWRMQLLATALKKSLAEATYVGMLMPTSLAGAVSFFALHQLDKTPVMLNFTAGIKALRSAIETTQLKNIITSRKFIEKGELQPLIDELSKHATILYLEDIREKINKLQALVLLAYFSLNIPRPKLKAKADDPAVILFTSGSEGVPKGVALSHRNILSNIAQVNATLHFTAADRMFNTLPIFHSFGLAAGMTLPLILGIPVYFNASPLQYKLIPKMVADSGSTILLVTDTFLRNYAQAVKGEEFKTLRLVVAGAEKLKETTSDLYLKRFGVEILQGYGVTETSPVLSVNAPDSNKRGTVGRLMPGMHAKLEPIEGITEGGSLHVAGPNVMLGYMKHEKPGAIQPEGEWYDTGDICTIDEDGYITIIGRAKRFAKVGGEMVSLAVVEEIAHAASPEHMHAAIAIPDERKGEQIILYSENTALTRERLITALKANGHAELYLPRQIIHMQTLPRLGNGKVDYVSLKQHYH